jgi:hypothetical protein
VRLPGISCDFLIIESIRQIPNLSRNDHTRGRRFGHESAPSGCLDGMPIEL